jgi:hypothetical protein
MHAAPRKIIPKPVLLRLVIAAVILLAWLLWRNG